MKQHDLDRRSILRRGALLAGGVALGLATPLALPTLCLAAEEKWGDLSGRLVYDASAPERKKLKVDKDLDCCGKFDIRDESLLVGEEGGLRNVFVYVRSPKLDVHPELKESAEKQVKLDNRNCIFMPHCLTIWQDQQEFHTINSDPVAQNVAFSPPGDAAANLVLAVGGSATYKFSRKQNLPVAIACNYHPWESALILPRDNPYAAITQPDGTFKLPKLPVGKWELQIWHERVGPLETPDWGKGRVTITIAAGSNDLGTFKINPAWLVRK